MRVLSALVLTHCFGCVLPDDSEDEFQIKKVYSPESTKNPLKVHLVASAINSHDKRSNERQKSSSASYDMAQKQQRSNRKIINFSHYDNWILGSVCPHQYPRTFIAGRYTSVPLKSDEIPCNSKLLLTQKARKYPCSRNNGRKYHRKLLSYPEPSFYKDTQNRQLGKLITPIRSLKEDRNGITKENYNELWDDWGNWSTCSVTCGNGRQVRWRHCSSENCAKGLKKAQIKSCRLKSCDSKNILHWLGIKT